MIEVDVTDGIGCVRLAHGKVNALDLELCQAIAETMRDLDSGAVRAIVLTGAGKAFSAGVDLHRVVEGGAGYVGAYLPALTAAFRAVFSAGKPVVAALNGHAIAGGCVLAMACDHRVMVETGAVIGIPELLVGVPFPAAAVEITQCALGPAVTRKLILDGTNYQPADALALGLADELSTAAGLPGRALAVADRLSAGIPADTFRYTKQQLRGEASRRMDACAEQGEPAVAALWRKAVADGRIRAFMDRTVSSRRDR